MVRVLTFACVIAVHTVSTVNPLDSVPAGSVVMLLHFTREAFFVLTAFVLVHRHAATAPAPLPFWRRRFLLVGVPYVVWTVIYTGLQQVPVPVADPVATLVRNLLTGTGWFHLYFLLVSLQFYLVFPAFRRLLTATRGHHGWLLAASAALQVAIDLWLHELNSTYAGSVFLSYQFFLVLGGVVAMHRDRVDAWIRSRRGVVVGAALVTGAAAEAWYQLTVPAVGAIVATDVFQPVMIPWVVAVCALFWAAGTAWRPRWVARASDRSFGVFLVHPAILWALTVGGTVELIPAPWSSVVAYAVAVGGSLLIVEVLRRTPLCLVLTGKSRPKEKA